jgi:hypothetical protein
MIPVLGNHIIAQLNLEAAYVGKTVAPNELPAMNSTMPARNWQRPPKNRMTPTRILGVAIPQACTPRIKMRKVPVANDKTPRGTGFNALNSQPLVG